MALPVAHAELLHWHLAQLLPLLFKHLRAPCQWCMRRCRGADLCAVVLGAGTDELSTIALPWTWLGG
jgi:hypothetical protein